MVEKKTKYVSFSEKRDAQSNRVIRRWSGQHISPEDIWSNTRVPEGDNFLVQDEDKVTRIDIEGQRVITNGIVINLDQAEIEALRLLLYLKMTEPKHVRLSLNCQATQLYGLDLQEALRRLRYLPDTPVQLVKKSHYRLAGEVIPTDASPEQENKVPPYRVDARKGQLIMYDGRHIAVNYPRIFNLAGYLVENVDRVIPYEEIATVLGISGRRAIERHKEGLRDILEDDYYNPVHLVSIEGFGIVLRTIAADAAEVQRSTPAQNLPAIKFSHKYSATTNLARYMSNHLGRVFTRFELIDILKPKSNEPELYINKVVSRIRTKLEQDPDNRFVIETIDGVGYVMRIKSDI